MSDVVYPSDGQVEPYKVKLTGTGDVVMVTADVDMQVRLVSLIAACDGTPTAFTFWLKTAAGTVFNIVNGDTIAANKSLQVKDHPHKLLKGESFCCKAGTANHIDVTASFALLGKINTEQKS